VEVLLSKNLFTAAVQWNVHSIFSIVISEMISVYYCAINENVKTGRPLGLETRVYLKTKTWVTQTFVYAACKPEFSNSKFLFYSLHQTCFFITKWVAFCVPLGNFPHFVIIALQHNTTGICSSRAGLLSSQHPVHYN
jgi:hypothetical protein